MKKALKVILKPLLCIRNRILARRHQTALRRGNELIRRRIAEKVANNQPIHVVFVCHRPAVWASLENVYNLLKTDPAFRVTIVAIPNKKQLPELGLNHEEYVSEGAEEYWKKDGCLQGYNYETGTWLDLEALEPDYVFFQTPYNICRPPQYHSRQVSRYALIPYVSYFGVLCTDDVYDECTPADFLQDLSFFFTQNPMDDDYVRNRLQQVRADNCQNVKTGFPRYDSTEQYRTMPCDIWNRADSFKMIWTPRWTTNEGNCHFFDFKDTFVTYCKANPQVELAFRPHPQAFAEWNATGELPEAEAKVYKQNFVDSNMHLDQSHNYFPLLYTSDCLITDRSTIFLDYYCTGKPIIYCTSQNQHDALFPEHVAGMYCVANWEELEKVLSDLQKGIDPLKDTRAKIIRENFIPVGETAAEAIRRCLKPL